MSRVSSLKLDVLREISTIGAGRAAAALGEMLNSRVDVAVPEARFYPFQQLRELLGGRSDKFFMLGTALKGEMGGCEYLLLTPNDAATIAKMLLGLGDGAVDFSDEMVQSSLKEIANILLSSYMNALSELVGFTVIVDVPVLTLNATAAEVEARLAENLNPAGELLYVKTHLSIRDLNFEGAMFFAPDEEGIKKIFNKLGIAE